MDFLNIFSGFEAVFAKLGGSIEQKGTKKAGKRAKKALLGLVLTGPKYLNLKILRPLGRGFLGEVKYKISAPDGNRDETGEIPLWLCLKDGRFQEIFYP